MVEAIPEESKESAVGMQQAPEDTVKAIGIGKQRLCPKLTNVILSIEFGSKKAVVGEWAAQSGMQADRVEIIDSKMGGKQTPLCVTWTKDPVNKKRAIGRPALTQRLKALPESMSQLTRFLDVQESEDDFNKERQFLYDDSQFNEATN